MVDSLSILLIVFAIVLLLSIAGIGILLYHDAGTPPPSPTLPVGSCCLNGTCTDGITQSDCTGTWGGSNSVCATTTCTAPSPPGTPNAPTNLTATYTPSQAYLRKRKTRFGLGKSCQYTED